MRWRGPVVGSRARRTAPAPGPPLPPHPPHPPCTWPRPIIPPDRTPELRHSVVAPARGESLRIVIAAPAPCREKRPVRGMPAVTGRVLVTAGAAGASVTAMRRTSADSGQSEKV